MRRIMFNWFVKLFQKKFESRYVVEEFPSKNFMSDFIHDGIRLVQTCWACPEQYDAFKEDSDVYVGYLRLRHGAFRVEDADENIIFTASPQGDGVFDDDEREDYLIQAIEAIKRTMK